MDSLLVIGHIFTAPANEITIDVTYTLRCCDSFVSWQLSIGMYVFMSSTRSSQIPNPNASPYTYVGELRNTSAMLGSTSTRFNSQKTIEMKGYHGIYLGFRDTGICGSIESVSMYYITCSEVTRELIRFPSTIAPNASTALVRISGYCVGHSEPRESDNFMLCYANGTSKIQGGCQCLAGYQNLSSSHCSGKPNAFTTYYITYIGLNASPQRPKGKIYWPNFEAQLRPNRGTTEAQLPNDIEAPKALDV